MIGVYLKGKRREFLEYTSAHAIEFIELFDLNDRELLSQIEALIVDAPVDITGAFEVVDVSQADLQQVLSGYVQGTKLEADISADVLCFAMQQYYAAVKAKYNIKMPLADFLLAENTSVQTEAITPEAITPLEVERFDIPVDQQDTLEEPLELSTSETNFFSDQEKSKEKHKLSPAVRQHSSTIATRRGSSGTVAVRPRGVAKVANHFQIPIVTLSSLTDKSGVSEIAYLLAQTIAGQHQGSKVLYLDLNLSNPNSMLNTLGLNPNTDATLLNILSLQQEEFIQNISLLTETVALANSSISMITLGQASFAVKRKLAGLDFCQCLHALADSFDQVVVDLGKLQVSFEYQFKILNSRIGTNLVLADASSSRSIQSFVSEASELQRNYDIVLNKYSPQSGAFVLNKQLKTPIATINTHKNIDAMILGHVPFIGTSLHTELSTLGGLL